MLYLSNLEFGQTAQNNFEEGQQFLYFVMNGDFLLSLKTINLYIHEVLTLVIYYLQNGMPVCQFRLHVFEVICEYSEAELNVIGSPEKNRGNFTVSRTETTLPWTSFLKLTIFHYKFCKL
jgi:hypothetical protein